jgi:hypothetical protein
MYLKDKYLTSGAFERFKTRIEATKRAKNCTKISPHQLRIIAIDIGVAYLNADMAPTAHKNKSRHDIDAHAARPIVSLTIRSKSDLTKHSMDASKHHCCGTMI